MRWPPYLLKMRFLNHDHDCGLWLPLFLIWPVALVFLLAIFIVLLPFALLELLFTWRSGWFYSLLSGIPALFRLLGNLRGLEFDIGGKEGSVHLELF